MNSVNSVFCNIGKELGAKLLVEYSKRFGFYSKPPLETPSNERAPSGLYKGTELFDPTEDTDVDPGRFAFGQERLLVTPLQMAMLAGDDRERRRPDAAVRRRPHRLAGRRRSSSARSREELGRAVKPETAHAVAAMMRDAVEERHGHGGADLRASPSAARRARPRPGSPA